MAAWRRRSTAAHRRSGPAGEERWWDPEDQAFAERPLLHHRDLGRGWIPVPMINNEERLDPWGDDPASVAVRAGRAERRLTALDEGAAWRRRSDGALLVARVEVYATDAVGPAREAWQAHGAACLDALWRARWREREREPGWIEARWRAEVDRPDALRPGSPSAGDAAAALDWFTIEDHTEAAATEVVTAYEHLTLWAGRAVLVLTLRHGHASDADAAAVGAALAAWRRAQALSRRSGPAPGSA